MKEFFQGLGRSFLYATASFIVIFVFTWFTWVLDLEKCEERKQKMSDAENFDCESLTGRIHMNGSQPFLFFGIADIILYIIFSVFVVLFIRFVIQLTNIPIALAKYRNSWIKTKMLELE